MGPIHTCECVVVGAGVIGLAIARALALMGKEVIILEAENNIGMHTSSRNSEVIHAGIYYPENSLKAKCCVKGKELLANAEIFPCLLDAIYDCSNDNWFWN